MLHVPRLDVFRVFVRHRQGKIRWKHLVLNKKPFSQEGRIQQLQSGSQRVEAILCFLKFLNLKRLRDDGAGVQAHTHRIGLQVPDTPRGCPLSCYVFAAQRAENGQYDE